MVKSELLYKSYMRILEILRKKAFNENTFLCKLIKNIGIGRFFFRIRLLLFRLDNNFGHFNQRFLEYPWILKKIGDSKNKIVLDIGCSGSLLSHELLSRKFTVVGIDINDHIFKNHRLHFFRTNILTNNFPSQIFDIIIICSVIEHIGFKTYLQKIINDDADFLVMKQIKRILKPNGVVIMTFPYEGRGPLKIYRWGRENEYIERRYDKNRLDMLLNGFKIVDSNYYLCMLDKKSQFTSVKKEILDGFSSNECEGSLACIMLKKKR